MIRKTLILTLILIAAYNLFVGYLAPSWWHASLNLFQDNKNKCENYLFNEQDTFKNIIIGSSLADRLTMDSLPSFYNLALKGYSFSDGLKIILYKKKYPKNIYIETNNILRAEDEEFLNNLLSPIPYFLKNHLTSLRSGKQPLDIVSSELSSRLTSKTLLMFKQISQPLKTSKIESATFADKKAVNHILEPEKIKLYSESILEEDFKKRVDYLKDIFELLEKNNVKITFFEMPIESSYSSGEFYNSLREYYRKYFPPEKYHYIEIPKGIVFHPNDGSHLDLKDASIYTSYLKGKIMEMDQKDN